MKAEREQVLEVIGLVRKPSSALLKELMIVLIVAKVFAVESIFCN
jgi:hypothetical protein